MAAPIGAVVEITYRQEFASQVYMNVLHYAVTQTSAAPDLIVETGRILDALDTPGEFGILAELLAVLPFNVSMRAITAQFITPVRQLRGNRPINLPGVWPTAALTGNIGATIQKQTALSGRRYIGSMHLACLPPDGHAAGFLNPIYITPLNELKTSMLLPIVDPVDGGQYDPVLFHRPSPLSPTPQPTPLHDGVVQNTVRVMRRRTVGVGV